MDMYLVGCLHIENVISRRQQYTGCQEILDAIATADLSESSGDLTFLNIAVTEDPTLFYFKLVKGSAMSS